MLFQQDTFLKRGCKGNEILFTCKFFEKNYYYFLKSLILKTIEAVDVDAKYVAHSRMSEYGGFKL